MAIDEPTDVVDALKALIDNSLLRQEPGPGGEARYTMLEIIREYAREGLARRPDVADTHSAHAHYYLAVVEAAEPHMTGPDQQLWLDRLECEHDNFRAALRWAIDTGRGEVALRLAQALARFWWTRSHLSEGRSWLSDVLRVASELPGILRAKLLYWDGILATHQGDYDAAEHSLLTSLDIYQVVGNRYGVALSLNALGMVANARAEFQLAQARYAESLLLFREVGARERVSTVLNNLGFTALLNQDYDLAVSLLTESLAIARESRDVLGMAFALNNLGLVALGQHDAGHAHALLSEALKRFAALGDIRNSTETLDALGELAVRQSRLSRAARLLAAAATLRARTGIALPTRQHEQHVASVARVCAGMSQPVFDELWAEGEAMSLEQAVPYALTYDTGTAGTADLRSDEPSPSSANPIRR